MTYSDRDDKDERIAALEQELDEVKGQAKERLHQAVQAASVLAVILREAKAALPALTTQERRRLIQVCHTLEHVANRPEAAQILATGIRNAQDELNDFAARWAQQTKRLDKRTTRNFQSDEPGQVQRNHPRTSRTAADLIPPTRGKQHDQILQLFYAQAKAGSNDGFTSWEIGQIISPHRTTGTGSSRLGELAGKSDKVYFGDWLQEREGATRPSYSGVPAQVYELTMFGREKLGLLVGPSTPREPEQPSLL